MAQNANLYGLPVCCVKDNYVVYVREGQPKINILVLQVGGLSTRLHPYLGKLVANTIMEETKGSHVDTFARK